MPTNNWGLTPQQYPQNNNLWVGNNYASGYSQASRSQMPAVQPYAAPMQQPITQEASVNNIIQAMSPEAASEYRVGPNSHVIMVNPNLPVFYMKHTDDTGHGETKAYSYHEIPLFPQEQQSMPNMDNYVTKQDLAAALSASQSELKKFMEELISNE